MDLTAKGGPSPLRQVVSLVRLTLGLQKMRREEYFTCSLWRADRGGGFLQNRRTRAVNTSLLMQGRGRRAF